MFYACRKCIFVAFFSAKKTLLIHSRVRSRSRKVHYTLLPLSAVYTNLLYMYSYTHHKATLCVLEHTCLPLFFRERERENLCRKERKKKLATHTCTTIM